MMVRIKEAADQEERSAAFEESAEGDDTRGANGAEAAAAAAGKQRAFGEKSKRLKQESS